MRRGLALVGYAVGTALIRKALQEQCKALIGSAVGDDVRGSAQQLAMVGGAKGNVWNGQAMECDAGAMIGKVQRALSCAMRNKEKAVYSCNVEGEGKEERGARQGLAAAVRGWDQVRKGKDTHWKAMSRDAAAMGRQAGPRRGMG